MSIQCKEILALSSLNELKLVAGQQGLDRLLRWVYVADSFDDTVEISNWIHGGELVFMSGIGLKGNTDKFARLVKELDAKGVAGLLVSIGPYIPTVPFKIRKLADALNLPVFELPWGIKFVDVTREISTLILTQEIEQRTLTSLLENILYSRFESEDELKSIAKRYHFDLLGSGLIGIADIDDFKGYLHEQNIFDEKQVLRIKDNFLTAFLRACQAQHVKVLTRQSSDSIIFLIQMQNCDIGQIRLLVKEARRGMKDKINGINVSFGIGRFYRQLNEMHLSLEEAEQALRVAQCDQPADGLCFFDELGIYSLLLNIAHRTVLEKYYHDCFDPLLEYDRINNASLMNTLETYLQENCSAAQASEKMYIHRNTLKYRIQKIEDLLGCNLKNFGDCSYYDVGYKIRKFLIRT